MKTSEGEIFATGKRYLVSPVARAERTPGGLFLPDNVHERVQVQGIVRELGTFVETDNDKYTCRVGDRVIHSAHAGVSVIIEGENWRVLSENDLVAVIRN